MPVSKTSRSSSRGASEAMDHVHFHPFCRSSYGSDFGRKILFTLCGILLAYAIVFFGTVIRNNLEKFYFIGQAEKSERAITIQGSGKVTATPDVAVTTLGMIATAPTVVEAQQKNTTVMNNLNSKLKALGVDVKDIQTTHYYISPKMEYTDGKEKLIGYDVNQAVTVKIRDLSKANQVLALVGEVGANTVSGLQLTIDDREVYLVEAREKALEDVRVKAAHLSESLGVRLVEILSYDETEGDGYGDPRYKEMAYSGGGPGVESGSMNIQMNVRVTYRIR